MDLPESPTTRRALLAGVGTVGAGGGIVYGASQRETESADLPEAAFHRSSNTTDAGVDLRGHPVAGSMDAPVDVYYWSDYQCPFCRRFERNTLPKLVETHVQSGTVRLVFVQYPYLGKSSMTAAVVDRCVWRQVRAERPRAYWRWHATLFDEQGSENSGWASRDNLLDVTRGVEGVDANAVDDCMRERRSEIESSIREDVERASRFDIRGTPAFVLYNREEDVAGKITGAQPFDRFDEAITRVQNA